MSAPLTGACRALLLVLTPPAATAQEDLFWEHRDWRTYAETGADGGRTCLAMTGGDGEHMLKLQATSQGELTLYFDEQTYRGLQPFLHEADLLTFRVDASPVVTIARVQPALGYDQNGIPSATASPPQERSRRRSQRCAARPR